MVLRGRKLAGSVCSGAGGGQLGGNWEAIGKIDSRPLLNLYLDALLI